MCVQKLAGGSPAYMEGEAQGEGGQQPPHLLRERVKCGDRESYSQEVV